MNYELHYIVPFGKVCRIMPRVYVPKGSILLVGTGVRKISSVACGFSPIKNPFF